MLAELRIRDLGVIADAQVVLGPGLTVVTGETGAGKTMVVSGLALLFGGRGDSSRVRHGVERAWIEGRLLLEPGPALERAAQVGAEVDEDGALLIARAVGADGRSRAVLGGRAVPLSVLGELASDVLAIHGQADQTRLLRPAEQRAALDRYAGAPVATAAGRYATAYAEWQDAERALAQRTTDARAWADEADRLRTGVELIDALDPQPGEDAELAALTRRLEHAETLQAAAARAHAVLTGDPSTDAPDVAALLGAARAAIGTARQHDDALADLERRVAEAEYLLADVAAELASYADAVEADPARLAAVHERRAALSAAVRRHADDVDGLLAWRQRAGRRLLELDLSDEAVAALRERRRTTEQTAAAAAAVLSAERRTAAKRFATEVSAELAGLAMPGATVRAVVSPRPAVSGHPVLGVDGQECGAGPEGCDDVALLLRPHPDAPSSALQKGASGGELSRVMLAVEVVLARSDPLPLFVFDEVDAGVGGRAAAEVGRRLARLARHHQVVVVTHLPQVAAYADRHVAVDKAAAGGVTQSAVRVLDDSERAAELARMLAGQEGSEHAREHARELLAAAARERTGP